MQRARRASSLAMVRKVKLDIGNAYISLKSFIVHLVLVIKLVSKSPRAHHPERLFLSPWLAVAENALFLLILLRHNCF